jgi:hypothetical protein
MSPGHIIMIPDKTLVRPRLGLDQGFDLTTQKVYHQALQAIHHMNTSSMNYCVQENINGRVLYINLKGENVGAYSHTHTKYNMVDDDQIATLGGFWKVLRVRPAAYATYTRLMAYIGIPSKQYVFVFQGQEDLIAKA